MLNTGIPPEGNDEEWEMMQKVPPEMEELAKSSLVLVIAGQYPRTLEYREKCVLAITEKWGGRFLPQFNEPKGLARSFTDLIWSTGVSLFRTTGDFLPSSSSPDGSPDMLKKLTLQEGEAADRYEQSGAFFRRGTGQRPITWRPEEQLSIGAQGISVALYDPYDPVSLEAARAFANELFDPKGKFRRFGITSRGGCLQIESVTHVHQNWGHLYDNYDVWLKKIKQMLDPNTVADWSAYIPPSYPEEGNYIPPSYGKKEKRE